MNERGDDVQRMIEAGAPPIEPTETADLGARRAGRRNAARAGLSISMLLVLVALIARPGRDAPRPVESIGTSTSTTAAPPSSSTTSTSTTLPATTSPSTTVGTSVLSPPVSVAPAMSPTTTTTVICRNSFEESCGPFYHDPPVSTPNTKPVVEFIDHATTAFVGEPYVLKVHVSDPDTPFQPESCVNFVDWGSPSSDPRCVADVLDCMRHPSGPWDPPVPEPSDFVDELTYTYTEPGTYEIMAFYDGKYSCHSPYAEEAVARFTLTVTTKP